MAKSFIDKLDAEAIQIDETLWGPGSKERITFFLLHEYDPAKMPMLAAADIKGREGPWLLGWESDGTDYPPLLVYLFGQEYADERLENIQLKRRQDAEADGRFGTGRQK